METTVKDNISYKRNMTQDLKRAFELFEEGKKGLEFSGKLQNAILFLGPTGSGKSTYAQLVCATAERVVAKEVLRGEFVIDDGNVKIGKSLINSKTVNPDRYVIVSDSGDVVSVFDFGGFGDTRKIKYDLAVNLLIKTVADLADSVKMIFFISHPFVRPQVDKAKFLNLLRHITDLVKDINKFRNGIALVVTKVDNITIMRGNQYVLLHDKSVIDNIAEFLVQVKQELKENLKNNVGDEEHYKKNAIQIIDILLTKNVESFSKIKLFRRPEKCGPLSTSTLREDAKRSFFEIFNSIDYVTKDKEDFGYCLSADSINVANNIVEEINQNISSNFKQISRIVQEHFQYIETNISKVIISIMADTSDMEYHCTNAKKMISEIRNAICVVGMLADEVKNEADIKKIIEIVRKRIYDLSNGLLLENENDLINQGKYLDFLQTVCKKEWSMGPYDGIFNNILLFVQDLDKHLERHIDECVRKTEIHLKSALEGLTTAIVKEYTKRMETLGPESVLSMLEKEKLIFSTMLEYIPVLKGTKERLETFCNIENDLSISFPADIRNRILNLKKRFLCFENLSNNDCSIDFLSPCMVTLQAVDKFIKKSQSWYKYLKDLHDNGSKYKIQKFKDMYNVKNLRDWGNPEVEKGICITPENYALFLEKVSSLSLAECSSVKNLQLSGLREEELNHVLSLIFKNEVKIDMTGTSVTVQGDYISLESLFSSEHNNRFNNGKDSLLTILSNNNIETVRFFAFHTIFIDQDLDFVGKKISVVLISPKWEVIGTRMIDLSGKNGDEPRTDHPQASADSVKVNDGAPGNPGGPGGDFHGIGETFINGNNLTIFANGGKGKAGRKGKAGKNGKDAGVSYMDKCVNAVKFISFGGVGVSAVSVFFLGPAAVAVPLVGSISFATVQGIAGYFCSGSPNMLERGGTGQHGGSGGKGGKGGFPGQISIIELTGRSEIIQRKSKGFDGCDGEGAPGGHYGQDKVLTSNIFGFSVELVETKEKSSNGSRGGNLTGWKTPDKLSTDNKFDTVIIEYKTLLKEILTDRFRKHQLEQFVALFPTDFS